MMYRLGFAGLVAALMGGPQLACGQSALQPVLVSTVQSDWGAATSSQPSGSESWSPEVIESTTPDFPRRALTEGIGGQCDATFQVDRNGYAANIQLECTPEMFSGSTMDAIRDWRFTPWTGEGSLSPWTTLPISYNLPGASDTSAPVEDSPPAKQPDSRVDNGEGASGKSSIR
ncbi:energy transducer TonB [Oceanicaulis sp. MMSF_3324]|uniref:energy transducer TonB n=1 Tax=Oceanicaulis sp. MMSF_3324 TaxID=3046702 RepID=UPI00273EB169|nr:energy transducer TonB [Oceanicaulis sp. MMSF_3324]